MIYSITGATGLVGNNLARHLLAAGHEVRVAVRPTSDLKSLADLNVDILEGDLSDPSLIAQLLRDSAGLFHCAAVIWLGYSRLEESRAVNVELTRHLATGCRNHAVKMVQVSTVDALAAGKRNQPATEVDINPAKPASAYVISKREAEQVVLKECQAGLNATIVNLGFVVGPYDWKPSSGEMMLAVARQFVPLVPGGGFCVANVHDVVRGMESAMLRGKSGERYILGGENMRYLDLFRRMATIVNRKPPIAGMRPVAAKLIGWGGDLIGKIVGRELQVNSAAIQMGQVYNYYDSAKAERELGYERSDVNEALREAWEWFRDNGYAPNTKKTADAR